MEGVRCKKEHYKECIDICKKEAKKHGEAYDCALWIEDKIEEETKKRGETFIRQVDY